MILNGPAITAIRERSGLTQTSLAVAAKITAGRVSQIERGRGAPGVYPRTARALADALGVPLAAILLHTPPDDTER